MTTTQLSNPFAGSHEASVHDAAPALAVSVVVPMFNERDCVENLLVSLRALQRALAGQFEFEFVLVDDGSADGTAEFLELALADRPECRIIRHGANRGIAAAIQTGVRAARYESVASIDSDGSYDPALIAELAPLLAPGVDLVTASPYHVDGAVQNVPLWRLRLSRLASQLYGVACWHKLTCYTSCCRVYRRSAVAHIELENEGFVGVAELLCKVLEQGGQVVEHPALLRARTAGVSKMRIVRATWAHLKLMARMLGRRLVGEAPPIAHSHAAHTHAADERRELSF